MSRTAHPTGASPSFTARRWALAAIAAAGLGLALPAQAQADAWPQKTIRIVVPYAPGGSADTLGRLIAAHLQTALKQSVIVDNRAGGGGMIGSQQVAKAAPDGYTLVVSGIGSHVIAPATNAGYNPVTDFSHIALLGGPPTVLVVHPSTPAKNVKELIAHARQTKGGLSWGSPGQGTHGHLIGELFGRATGIPQTHIGYKGAGPAVTDLVGGQIPAAFITLPSAAAHIKSGRLRALAVTSERRVADYPNVPTFQEAGYGRLTATTWFSLSGPAGLPPAIVDRLNAEVRRGLKTPAAQKTLSLDGIETFDWDDVVFTRFVRSEVDRWAPLARAIEAGTAAK